MISIVLSDMADKRFRLLRSMLTFCDLSTCLFVCLSVTFVHFAQTQKILTRFLLYTTRDSATVAMESLYISNHHRSFEWYHCRPPIQPTLPPKWGSQMHTSGSTSRRVLPPSEYDRRWGLSTSDARLCQITSGLVKQNALCS